MPPSKVHARFIEPMLLLPAQALPEGAGWLHELNIEGTPPWHTKTADKVHVCSRNNNEFRAKYPAHPKGLAPMPASFTPLDRDRGTSFLPALHFN